MPPRDQTHDPAGDGRWLAPVASRLARSLALVLAVPALLGFAHAKVGDRIGNTEMPTLDGGRDLLLGETNVSVFVFINPDKTNSLAALRQIGDLQKKLTNAPVHWAVVVSDRVAPDEARAAADAAGLSGPILVDEGDALFGRLGVALYPVIGITDAEGVLRHYLPFHKVNYEVITAASLRHTLGEIDDEELDRALHPVAIKTGEGSATRRHARLKLATRVLESGKPEKALGLVDALFLGEYPDNVQALVLRGRILVALDKPDAARAAFQKTLELEPDNAAARESLESLPDVPSSSATPPDSP